MATLYANSTMERHHLNQCLLLLNIPGNRILENMSEVAIKELVKPGHFMSNKLVQIMRRHLKLFKQGSPRDILDLTSIFF